MTYEDSHDGRPACYISVDVETSGPNPADYDLLSIGACLVAAVETRFYVELMPVTGRSVPEALAVSGLSMAALAEGGTPPAEALAQFEAWLAEWVPASHRPIFVALNAPFDWMFVNDYFHRFRGHNPFGHSALDIKAFYMGLHGVEWAETSMRALSARYLDARPLTHNALQDAVDQAHLFARLLQETPSGP
jgi:DNA polymerase III epsilon subunit-like protein